MLPKKVLIFALVLLAGIMSQARAVGDDFPDEDEENNIIIGATYYKIHTDNDNADCYTCWWHRYTSYKSPHCSEYCLVLHKLDKKIITYHDKDRKVIAYKKVLDLNLNFDNLQKYAKSYLDPDAKPVITKTLTYKHTNFGKMIILYNKNNEIEVICNYSGPVGLIQDIKAVYDGLKLTSDDLDLSKLKEIEK